jgi:hypothetical protein
MNPVSGTGPTLREASPYLRDDAECIARILDVAERDSMMEGLPPFDEALRKAIRHDLETIFSGSTPPPLLEYKNGSEPE